MYNLVLGTGPIRRKMCWNPIKIIKTAAENTKQKTVVDSHRNRLFFQESPSPTHLAWLAFQHRLWPILNMAISVAMHGNTLRATLLSNLCQVLHALQPDALVSPQNVESSSVSS